MRGVTLVTSPRECGGLPWLLPLESVGVTLVTSPRECGGYLGYFP